jgi:hypothetical protein
MFYQRTNFPLTVIGGTGSGDSGLLVGELSQLRWTPDTPDTGQAGSLAIVLVPGEDTGSGWTVFEESVANFGAGFSRVPRQPQHRPDGSPDLTDTGNPTLAPVVGGLDKLRVRLEPADTGVVISGTLLLWCGR